jgi:hypothetical protein
MTSGYPTDAADNAVQANVVAAGYSGQTLTPNGPQGTVTGPGGKCVDVAADDTAVQPRGGAVVGLPDVRLDQHWTHFADNTLRTLGRCLDINGNGTANGTQVELWDCNGVGGQKWVQQADGSLRNPQSGRCLDSPNGAPPTAPACRSTTATAAAAQKFAVNGGGADARPGRQVRRRRGRRHRRQRHRGPAVGLPVLRRRPALVPHSNGSLRTLGRCLDINGNGTANGTQVELWDCNGVGGQVWQQQADGSLRNPQSGRCLDSPNGATATAPGYRSGTATAARHRSSL